MSQLENEKQQYKPGSLDVNGKPIPRYIVYGEPALAKAKGLDLSQCQYIREPVTSAEHRKNREAMIARWVMAGAQEVWPDDDG